MVERVNDEGANEAGSQEDDRVDETNNPLVSGALVDAKLLGKTQVCAVGASLMLSAKVLWSMHTAFVGAYLIPTLSSSTDGAERD